MSESLIKTTDEFKGIFETIRVELNLCGKCNVRLLQDMKSEIESIIQQYGNSKAYSEKG